LNLPLAIITLLAATLLLYKGADWLVSSSILTARALGISKLLIGITIVAFGTSLPELLVSSIAAFQGLNELALGNIIGSCIFNLAVVMGISAIIRPYQLPFKEIRNSLLVLIAANIIFTLVLLDSTISFVDGLLMLIVFFAYISYLLISERRSLIGKPKVVKPPIKLTNLLLMVLGLLCLAGGAQLLVMSASFLARELGISELVIGISIVAVGTSLPEVATSVVASIKKHEDISFANVIGSNAANLLLIVGFIALIQAIRIDITEIVPDLIALHGLTILVLILFFMIRKLGRAEGITLVSVYLGYMIYLYLR
jgi:cation:H+ antiporter